MATKFAKGVGAVVLATALLTPISIRETNNDVRTLIRQNTELPAGPASYPFGHRVKITGNKATDNWNGAKETARELGEVAVIGGALLIVPISIVTAIGVSFLYLKPRRPEELKPPKLRAP